MRLVKFFIIFTFLLAFAVCISAQSNPYPNELEGYRFFNNGKLKTLRLLFSTEEDVKNIFGENCKGSCSYDSNWAVSFNYFKSDSCFTTQTGDEKKQIFCPDKKFIGKLSYVKLRPKKIIPFAKVSLSNFNGYGGGGSISEDGKGNGTSISYRIFTDGYGLSYEILDEVNSTEKHPTDLKKGDLFAIEYELSDKLSKKIFIRQK